MKERERVENRLVEMMDWENEFFLKDVADVTKSYHVLRQKTFEQLSDQRQQQLLSKADQVYFHIHSWLQQSRSYEETRLRIIQFAKTIDPDINDTKDLHNVSLYHLDYLAEQLMAKQRLLAFGQGGVVGIGGILLLALDLPALALIQLQSLQQLALVYGYDTSRPIEMMFMLKIFHVATLPKTFQKEEWDQLFVEIDEQMDQVFYEGDDSIFQENWIDHIIKQIGKGFLITMFRKKLIQGVPLLGMAIGAGMNYHFTKQVIEIGQRFYQKRRLLEKMAHFNR